MRRVETAAAMATLVLALTSARAQASNDVVLNPGESILVEAYRPTRVSCKEVTVKPIDKFCRCDMTGVILYPSDPANQTYELKVTYLFSDGSDKSLTAWSGAGQDTCMQLMAGENAHSACRPL